jgi:hypothetical protein
MADLTTRNVDFGGASLIVSPFFAGQLHFTRQGLVRVTTDAVDLTSSNLLLEPA